MKALRRLAAAYGVLTSYYGVNGLTRARPEALLGALELLGAPVRSMNDVESALRARVEELRRRAVEPVVVLWDDEPPAVPFCHGLGAGGRVIASVALENGSAMELAFAVDELPAVRARLGRHRVERRLPLPERPPLGYHHLSLTVGGDRSEALLLSAPRRSFGHAREKQWGLFTPLYAAASRQSWGAGDFSDLERLVDLASTHGAGFIATLPLFAGFVEDPSPYSPVSRLFWNELYVDPRRLPEWKSEPHLTAASPTNVENEDRFIDYGALEKNKRPVLEVLSREALRSRGAALESFVAERPELLPYARFRAAKERGGRLDGEAARVGLEDGRVLYHVYGQMAAEEQLAAAAAKGSRSGASLYFDLPLGVNRSGFDCWNRSGIFAHAADVGAPPDPVFTDGQNWGFPPLLPEKSRAEAHRYLRESVRHAMRHASLLRVDHVMGLHRQFWIPSGIEKRDGLYVRYPADELYAVFNIESHRQRCELVGENLGIVPEAVNRRLERHGWRGIYVMQFSLTGRREAPVFPIPEGSVASFNTHDTPTFAGFVHCRDLEERVEAGLLDREKAESLARSRAEAVAHLDEVRKERSPEPKQALSLHERFDLWLKLLLESDAELVAITLEDLWLEEAPQNVPGRTDLPNWRRKLRYCIDALPETVIQSLAKIER